MKKGTLLHCFIACLFLFVVNSTAHATDGNAWRAIDFNGTNSYINITYNGSTQYPTDFFIDGFTIDFWAMADYSGFGYFYCFDSGFGYTGLYYDRGKLGISSVKTYPSTEANYYLTDISSYSNKWTHFTLEVNKDDYATLYINGVKNADINNTYVRQIRYIIYQKELNNFRVGRRLDGGYFKGKISGFRFWKKCLTDAEVAYVWERTFTGQRTLLSNYQYLWSYIRCNMFVGVDNNIYSLGGGSYVWEYNTTLLTNYFHPGRPPMPDAFAKQELCGTTDLTWQCYMSSVNRPNMIIETEGEKTNLGYTFKAKAEDYPQQHKPGVAYEYKVYSEWNTGNSVIKQSDPVTLSAVVQEPVDSAVFNVSTVNDNNSLNVNWTWHPTDDSIHKDYLEQFDIYRKITDSAYTYLGHVPADQRNFVDSLAESCTYYYYKIQPHNVCTDVSETQGISPESIITRDYSQAFSQNGAYFEASKGYYDKDVKLNWKINPDFKNDIMGYELYRKDAVSGTYALLHTFDNNNYTSYSDADADANNMYTYMIRAVDQCDNGTVVNTLYTDSLENLGFRVATGIVSGNISFEGGNPVQGAEVFAEPENDMESYSIELGSGEYMVSDDSLKDISSLNSSDISVEFYVYFNQFSPSDSLKVFNLSNTLHYYVKDGYPGIVFNGSLINGTYKDYVLQSDSAIQNGAWNQVTITLSRSGEISLYSNGVEVIRDTIDPVSGFGRAEDRIVFGDQKFFGKIDEIRIWNRVKTIGEIRDDYKRKLSGKENGLVLYWKLYEGIFDRFYDISKTGTEFNKHNGRLLNATTENHWSTYVPPFLKLHPAGITDKFGNYVIEGFPYQGSGNIFSVIPVLGVHEFAPVKTNLFVGDNSPVHNNVNFKDMSAFDVSGNVKYLGENFPVEGVEILLDGDNMYDVENNIIKTDADGNFSVKVPIGQHVLSIRKDGHVFVEASYPPKSNGKTVLKDFQDDVSGIQFVDSTKRIITGRVVGGIKEGDKKIGFGMSVNNIGSYTITLEAEKGYNYKRTVTTDSVTGEYELEVLPEKYIVKDISGNPDYLFDLTGEGPLDLTNISERTKVTDTVWSADGNTVDTVYEYEYDLKKNWIYRSPISINVTKPNGNPVICDSVLDIQGKEVPVYSVDGNGNVSYLFGQPVFANKELDTLKITVNEEYTNYQNQNKYISPVQDAIISVNNNLAMDASPKQFAVDENGVAFYSFIKGNPNMSADALNPEQSFTKTLQIKAQRGAESVDWLPNGNVYRAINLGVQLTGTNFVTKGPDRVDFVLRDPPGSNSSSYVEKGFTLERTETKSRNKGYDARLGVFVAWGEDSKAGPVSSHESTWEKNNTFTQSITFNNGYSTSDDPAYTGDMGDVFFGTSTNITYGLCKMLGIFPVDSCNIDLPSMDSTYQGYKIGQMYNFAMGDEIATTFVYTQNHVENYLLPDLMRMRNNYFSTTPSVYALNDAASKDKMVPAKGWYTYNGGQEIDSVEFYQAAINAWVSELAVNELQKLIADGDIRKSYTLGIDNEFWDMVSLQTLNIPPLQAFNITVGYGKSQVKTVVYRKLDRTSVDSNLQDSISSSGEISDISKIFNKNISFDAGASYQGSMTSSMETSVEHTYEFQTSNGFESEVEIGGFKVLFVKIPGMKIETSAHLIKSGTNTNETGSTHESTVGYTLADEDQGDYYTVDIAKDEYGNGPVFIKRGGQTSCPYEDVTKTKYIKPGTDIGSSTMRIEVPTIQADQSVMTNVPEDMPAVFTVKLGNESEAEADNWYMLDVDAASNPDGAKITMDGSSLNSGTAIMVPANTQLTKHIEFRKGLQDVNDYKNIRLILHSMCQYDPTDDIADIADTVELSASFIPVCSKVNVVSPDNNWLVNQASQDTLQVRVSDYDLQSSTLQKIAFQYKAASDASWVTNAMMFKDTAGYSTFSGTKYLIGDNPYVLHKMGLNNMSDRIYQIRAVSMCSDGSKYESDPKTGTVDRHAPQVFGTPSPADGILDPNDEIMISFNEPIESGLVNNYNIDVKGVLNGAEIKHGTSVSLDGSGDYIQTPSGISLDNRDYSIECWLQKEPHASGVLVSQGTKGGSIFKIYFTPDSLVVASDGNHAGEKNSFDDGLWHHYSFIYNNDKQLITVYVDNELLFEKLLQPVSSEGPVYICKNSATGGQYLKASLHDLRIWKNKITYGQVIEFLNNQPAANETGLFAYWLMDEAEGNVLHDKVHNRTASLYGGWNLNPGNSAYSFNGIDQNLVFNATTTGIEKDLDMTIECWFKTPGQSGETCIFSNENSEVHPRYTDRILSINITGSGKISVETNSNTITTDQTFNDDLWHHLAYVVNRRGYATLYVDGEKLKNIPSSEVGSLQSAFGFIGCRGYMDNESIFHFDRYFKGSIDEFRIWKVARKQEQIKLYKNHRLKGDETGLIAYFPFETYEEVMGVMQSATTLDDLSVNPYTGNSNCGTLQTFGTGDFTSVAPAVTRQRPVSSINYDFVVNNDKIIITPSADLNKIENCILEITVQGIMDKNGNELASPATWTAYINKDDIAWGDSRFDLKKEVDSTLHITTSVMNNGGTTQTYSLSNIPDWLNVMPTSGALDPEGEVTIDFTLKNNIPIGDYAEDIYLQGNMGFNEKLPVNLHVYMKKPDWKVDETKFMTSMNVVSQIKVKGIFSNDKEDMIGVFSGDQCRGVASLQYVQNYDDYFAFLVIYGNPDDSAANENLTYKIWDASEGKIYTDVTPVFNFKPMQSHGNMGDPVVFAAGDLTDFNIVLNKGWSWISINSTPDDPTVSSVFRNLSLSQNDLVKYNDRFAAWDPSMERWTGSLIKVEPGKLYRTRISNGGTLTIKGTEVSPSLNPLTIVPGWNRIGFLPTEIIPVNEALSGFNPQPNDIIKGQFKFAMYDGNQWMGSLERMTPGHGYMYFYDGTDTIDFIYPEKSETGTNMLKMASVSAGTNSESQYEYAMSIVARVNGIDVTGQNKLTAWIDGKPRGMAVFQSDPSYSKYSFITVFGNAEDLHRDITFKLNGVDKEISLQGSASFKGNSFAGTITNPVDLLSGEQHMTPENLISVYPNPFSQTLFIKLSPDNAEKIDIKLYTVDGALAGQIPAKVYSKGQHIIDWKAESKMFKPFMPGVYLLHVTSDRQNKIIKIIKK